MLQDTRLSRIDILSLKYSGSSENLARCHGMEGEQTERQPREVPVPRAGADTLYWVPRKPHQQLQPHLLWGCPRPPLCPRQPWSHSLVIFARVQILVLLLRALWDNDRLLVEAEHDLSSKESSSALLGKSTSVPIYNPLLFLFSLLFSLNVSVT